MTNANPTPSALDSTAARRVEVNPPPAPAADECLMDDGTHERARPGHDLCPPCERSMARFRHECSVAS